MTWLNGARLATLGLLAAAAIGLWQAMRLESWSFDGPGPGFFPQLVAAVCLVLSIVVLIAPGKAGATEDGDTDAVPDTPRARRTFLVYAASFAVMTLGSFYCGFTLTALAVSVLILRFGEGRSWSTAFGYGVAIAVIGLVCFGWWLQVDLPGSIIEQQFYALVR